MLVQAAANELMAAEADKAKWQFSVNEVTFFSQSSTALLAITLATLCILVAGFDYSFFCRFRKPFLPLVDRLSRVSNALISSAPIVKTPASCRPS